MVEVTRRGMTTIDWNCGAGDMGKSKLICVQWSGRPDLNWRPPAPHAAPAWDLFFSRFQLRIRPENYLFPRIHRGSVFEPCQRLLA